MKQLLLSISLLFFSIISLAQSDSAKEIEPHYFYLTGGLNVATNTTGTFNKRTAPSFEFGSTFGIFDIGLAMGRLNLLKNDSSYFFELRPTINVFSKGRFSEGLCLGVGYRKNASQKFMTEICNSINFNFSNDWAVAIVQGYYYFDGVNSNSNAQFFGLNFTHNFLKKNSINTTRKRKSLLN